MSKEFKFVVAILASFVLLALAIAVFGKHPDSERPLGPEKLICYEGILYFNTRHTYLSGAVIDQTTLLPKICGR